MNTLHRLTMPVMSIGIVALTLFTVQPYNYDVTSLFHLDALMDEGQPVPNEFVVLDVPAYDGAHYYQIARNIPEMFAPDSWEYLRSLPTLSYAYQRLLLPATAYILSFGQEPFFPYAFVLINIASIIGAAWLTLRATGKPLYAYAMALCPSATVALHFSLAEPMTLLLLTAFLTRFVKNDEKLKALDVILLSLLTLSREVNILFMALLTVYLLWRKNWRDAALMIFPILTFCALHGWIYAIFGDFPFLTSAGKRTLPFEAMFHLVTGAYGYNRLTITSIPLALLFVIPMLGWTSYLAIAKKNLTFLPIATGAFLLLMTTMPDYIWGSITSIGRVITPIYPLSILLAAQYNTRTARLITAAIGVIGLGAGVSLALIHHPYTLA